jgi:adenylosuccinate synthase
MIIRGGGFLDLVFGDSGKGNVVSTVFSELERRVTPVEIQSPKPVLVYSGVGGNNAANTYSFHGKEVILRQLAGGLLLPGRAFSQMGEQKYIRPRKLMQEILHVRELGFEVSKNTLGIAPNAHITLQYHLDRDTSLTQRNNSATHLHVNGQHTGTGNGIGPTAQDKYGRSGIRFMEFLDRDLMVEILCENQWQDERAYHKRARAEVLADSYKIEREFLAEFPKLDIDAFEEHGFKIGIAANAHGSGLDIDIGMYPGITSSHPSRLPLWANPAFGVVKLYASSVGFGDRAFVSQIEDLKLESALRNAWGERGTGTGKDRGIGYFDTMQTKYAARCSGVKYLIGTCGDRMEDFYKLGVKPKITIAYKVGGRTYDRWDPAFHERGFLQRAKAVNIEMEPWESFTQNDGKTLTKPAHDYVNRIEQETGLQFIMYTHGPNGETDATILEHPLDIINRYATQRE